MSAIAGVFNDPREVLARLVEAFVATIFANPELAAVYDTERVNLGPSGGTCCAIRSAPSSTPGSGH